MSGITAKMELVGLADTIAALNALPPRLVKGTLDRVLRQVAEPILQDAAARVRRRTGRTAAKLTISKSLSARQKGSEPLRDGPWERVLYIGAKPGRVAHLLEFGTRHRATRGGGRKRPGMKPANRGSAQPLPFMRPAWDTGKDRALAEFGRILGIEVERTAARLAKRLANRA
jgi:hypothetical protein